MQFPFVTNAILLCLVVIPDRDIDFFFFCSNDITEGCSMQMSRVTNHCIFPVVASSDVLAFVDEYQQTDSSFSHKAFTGMFLLYCKKYCNPVFTVQYIYNKKAALNYLR